jgi:hypothetical protein
MSQEHYSYANPFSERTEEIDQGVSATTEHHQKFDTWIPSQASLHISHQTAS